MEKPHQPPGPSGVEVAFWLVSCALIGGAAGSTFAGWVFGPNVGAFVVFVSAGFVAGGALGTLRGLRRRP